MPAAAKLLRPYFTLVVLTALLVSCNLQNRIGPPDATSTGTIPLEPASDPVVVEPAKKPPSLPVAGESPAPAASADTDQLVMLKVGESASLSPSIRLDFVRVLSDSRCPVGTQCIWAGEVKLELKLHLGAEEKTFTLTDRNNIVSIMQMQVKLLAIDRANAASFSVRKI